MVTYAQKRGIIQHDPFMDIRFHYKPVDRGFLTEEEVIRLSDKDLSELPRLELVRDIFLFSCFTGLAYIDVSNLTPEHIVSLDGNDWIMTKRQKTSTHPMFFSWIYQKVSSKNTRVKLKEKVSSSLFSVVKDEFVPERDCRHLCHQEELNLSYSQAHFCYSLSK